MEAKVLFSNEQQIAAEQSKFEIAARELNEINDFLIAHKLEPLTQETAAEFIRNPKEALRDVYKSKIPAVNEFTGLSNDRDRMLENMQIPAIPGKENFPYSDQVKGLLSVYDFGKKIVLNTARFESYLNNFRFVTDDPRIIEAFEDFQALAEMLEKINDKLHFIPLNGLNSINFDYRLGDVIAFTKRGFEIQQRGFQIAVGLLRR